MLDLKEQGNQLYKQGQFLSAAAAYTKAIKQEPGNAILYSNRSAALLKLNKLAKALADAEECVKLQPSWEKGWMRKGMVHELQGQLQEALECFQQANKAAGGHSEYAVRIKDLKLKLSSQQGAAKRAKPAEEVAALRYADAKLAYAQERVLELGNSFTPELHLLHPATSSNGSSSNSQGHPGGEDPDIIAAHPGMKELQIRAQHAFNAPDVLSMFVGEMRQQAQDVQAIAAVLVAPKSAVAFPQTWRQQSWQHGSHDGILVQLQALVPRPREDDTTDKGARSSSDGSKSSGSSSNSRILSKTWFIRLRPDKPPSPPVEVGEEFGLLPPILK